MTSPASTASGFYSIGLVARNNVSPTYATSTSAMYVCGRGAQRDGAAVYKLRLRSKDPVVTYQAAADASQGNRLGHGSASFMVK